MLSTNRGGEERGEGGETGEEGRREERQRKQPHSPLRGVTSLFGATMILHNTRILIQFVALLSKLTLIATVNEIHSKNFHCHDIRNWTCEEKTSIDTVNGALLAKITPPL